MKTILISISFLITCHLSACSPSEQELINPPVEIPTDNGENNNGENETSNPSENIQNMKLEITIGNTILTATLVDNPTARDFITLLPLTVKLDDFNNTEKIFYPDRKLSIQEAPSNINPVSGDITYYSPWGNIAIFYKDFRQSSGLIPIAKIDSGIEALQVPGSIDNVRFEITEKEE